jgi:hypothetical protein
MGETRNAYTILVGEPECKKPHCKSRRKWGIVLICILKKYGWIHGLDPSGSGEGPVGMGGGIVLTR